MSVELYMHDYWKEKEMRRTDEISFRLKAFKHWREKGGDPADETFAPDMEYLLTRISRLEEALKYIARGPRPDDSDHIVAQKALEEGE